MVEVLVVVAAGVLYLLGVWIGYTIGTAPAPPTPGGLTPREVEIMRHVALGYTNKDIARRLEISPNTVKNHVHMVLRKTGLPRRAALGAYMKDNKL